MKVPVALLSLALLASAACHRASTAGPASEARPPLDPEVISPSPASTPAATPAAPPAATPDPASRHRDRLLARIDGLDHSACDALVLQFQIIPRDEILDPLSDPKKELLRYVKRIASAEDLDALERALEAGQRDSSGRPGAMSRPIPERTR